MNTERLDQLLNTHFDGLLDEAGRAELEGLLLASAEARTRFWEIAEVHGLAGEAARLAWGDSTPAAEIMPAPRVEVAVPFWRWLAPLAAAIVLVGGMWFLRRPVAPMAAEVSAAGFAVVSAQSEAVWLGGRAVADGDLLAGESRRLESGVVQLDLFSGVTVVFEGPAEFRIVSPMELRVVAGKVRARVPEAAQGFRILTAQGTVVDLGTEFAVNVGSAGSELHVLEGAVEWHPHREAMRPLKTGEAIGWTANGGTTELAADARGFVGAGELDRRTSVRRASRREAWLTYSATLRGDPRLVAYYTMDQPTGAMEPTLPDRATGAGHAPVNGAIVAAAGDTDRWGQARGALDFSRAGSRVRLAVPGEFASLTLLCWVKINSLDRRFNSLFLTDGFDPNEPHWQIHNDYRLVFVRRGESEADGEGRNFRHLSPPIWNPTQSGKWIMLATVFDAAGGRVTHYLDGQPVSHESIPERVRANPMTLGPSSLGNWNLAYREDPNFAIRNLNGSMDEFALFSAALSPAEIAEIYDHGKP